MRSMLEGGTAYRAGTAPRLSDHYVVLLCGLLLGYALLGKGFAYLGLPPLYVGELTMLAGIVVFLRNGAFLSMLATLPGLLLALLMAWVVLRTLPFVGSYGVDALRDSVIVVYAAFAFIVTSLLLQDARRLEAVLSYYAAMAGIFVAIAPFTFFVSWYLLEYVPRLPGSDVPIIWLRAGEAAVHLGGIAAFAIAGFWRLTPLRILALLVLLAMVAAGSRSAMLAALFCIVASSVLVGRSRELMMAGAAGLVLLMTAYVVESQLMPYQEPEHTSDRSASVQQIVENAASIFGSSGEQTEGTKEWRMDWWRAIIDDTIHGDNFWRGRGFGINLAEADGFVDTDHIDRAPLRSPHSAHMTMLARAGVPGLVLWTLVFATWGILMLQELIRARIRGDRVSVGIFAFVISYAGAMIINASFDVSLEGPMQGIWFWCIIGYGLGAAMIRRAERAASVKRPNSKPATDGAPAAAVTSQ